jgi:hypothetical protein
MKKFSGLGIAIALAFFVSCGKQQTEAERNAEIERQVQQRLAAERQADEQQKLAQREADLKAREDALAQKEKESAPTATPQMRGGEMQQREVTEAAQIGGTDDEETASYDTFYTKLEPYGAWRETSDYGYVFQPNESARSRNWRPYTNGRWVYTDAGWTWYSDEPFGWATYHYGRWTRLRHVGWVWVPGDEWAPAWVSWRKSDAYVGWAPLPPEARFDRTRGIHNWADNDYDLGPEQYAFVPTPDFGDERIERTIVPIERNITIVNQTVNVTNITYNNTTIVNQGPNYDELRQRTRQPIQRLRLERRQRFERENLQATVHDNVIAMSAPAIAPARQTGRPRVVKEKIAKAVVDRDWVEVRDKKAAEQARAKMKADANLPAGVPLSKATPAPTPESVEAAETPVRNLPDRARMKPYTSAPVAPGIRTIASPVPALPSQTKEAERRMNETQRARKEKEHADEIAARQRKMEERGKGRAAQTQSASPSPVPRPTPVAKALPKATVAKPAPPVPVKPQATPVTTQTPAQTRLPSEKTPAVSPTIGPASGHSRSTSASSATPAAPDAKKSHKDKRKNRRNSESPGSSPAASPR